MCVLRQKVLFEAAEIILRLLKLLPLRLFLQMLLALASHDMTAFTLPQAMSRFRATYASRKTHTNGTASMQMELSSHAPQVTFEWDNSFAWMHSKTLQFRWQLPSHCALALQAPSQLSRVQIQRG